MKFRRQHPRALRPVTGRRPSAAGRPLQPALTAVALSPDLQPTDTPQQRIARMDAAAEAHLHTVRDRTAATWRRARRAFRALTPAQREHVLGHWNAVNWHPPHEAHYLAGL